MKMRNDTFGAKVSLLALMFVVCGVSGIHAQVAGGTLIGTISDPSKAVIFNSKISIEDTATQIVRVVYTNHDGLYTAPNLLPGTYAVTASASGFRVKQRSGVVVTVGGRQIVDFSLDVGPASKAEVVVNQDDSPALHLATSEVSEEVTGQTIRDMPLNGRSWTDLATLQPGVAPVVTQPSFTVGTDRGTRGFGSEIAISGARPQQNNYRLDGISLNDYSNGAPGSVLGGNLGVDAIQEFSVVTTNASAEYGKTAGGVVNAITRSGTNNFHGELYELDRNSALDARNYFDTAGSTPDFSRNQFGAAIGGPIVKDNTFFFANYEGLLQSQSVTTSATVPSQNARNGIIQDSNGNATTFAVDPSAQKYLVFWPLPNAGATPTGNGNTGFYKFGGKQSVNEQYGTARIDHRFSDRDNLSGTYLYDHAPYTYPDGLNDVLHASITGRHLVALEETHVFSTRFMNALRIGLNRESVENAWSQTALNSAAADPSLAADPGQFAAQVSISGVTSFTGGLHASGGTDAWTDYQVYDDAFISHGNQALKFGFVAERMLLNVFTPNNPAGQFVFGSLTNFLTNKPSQYNAQIPQTVSPRDLRQTLAGAYLQDDWRWTPRLTLNLGLRYEIATVPTEKAGRLAALRNLTDPSPHLGSSFFQNPTLANFEPRVGFSWAPFQKRTTVLRAAIGMYDVLPLPYEFILPTTGSAPFTEFGTVKGSKLPAGTFYQGAESLLGLKSLRVSYVQPTPKRNYVVQWNLNVEQEFTKSLTGSIAYVGSRGVHQPYYSNEFNIVMPTLTQDGYIWPINGSRINSNFGSIRGLMWTGSSSYNGLEVGIHERLARALQFQSSFTWSKSIDTTSSSLAPDAFGNAVSTLPYFAPRRGRGLSDFNVGKILVLNSVWQLPAAPVSKAVGLVTNGWQVSGIFRASDGVPFTATFGSDGDPLGSGGVQDYPDRLSASGCQTLTNPGHSNNYVKTNCFTVPTASPAVLPMCDKSQGTGSQCYNLLGNSGRNVLIGPGTTNLDASLLKDFSLPGKNELWNVQFHADFFNLLNHANFALPGDTNIFDSTGAPTGDAGVITATSTPSREVQFGLRVRW